MTRVPITVMGFRCERCDHEWIPRGGVDEEPATCPKCKSPWWNKPKHALMTYEVFRDVVAGELSKDPKPLTWTEIRTRATLPQAFPNNQWVRRMEADVGLQRRREKDGTILWQLGDKELPL